MGTATQAWTGLNAGLGGGWRRWRRPAAAAGWWGVGVAAALPSLYAAWRYPQHAGLVALALAALLAVAGLVLRNPAWGVCALIVIIYWNASDVVTDTWGFSWLLRLAMAGVIVAGAGQALLAGPERRWRWPVLLPFLAYGAAQAAAAVGAIDPAAARAALVEWGKAAVVFYLVANLLRTPRALRWAVNAVLLGAALLAAPVIYQGVSGSHNLFWGFGSMVYKEIVPGEFGWRLGGAMGDPNFLAMVLVAALPLGLMQALEAGAGWRRAWGLLASGMILAATLFTYSRGSLFGVVLVVAVLGWKHRRRRWVWAGALAAALAAGALMPQGLMARLASLSELRLGHQELADSSFQQRRNADYAGLLMLWQHPLLGVGPGNYPVNYLQYSAEVGLSADPTAIYPHNLYLQIASETGLCGLVAFGALMWASFGLMEDGRRRLRRLGADNYGDLIWALELALASYLVVSIFLHGAYFRHFLLLLALGTLGATLVREKTGTAGAAARMSAAAR